MSDTIDLILNDEDGWVAIATNPVGLNIKSNGIGRWYFAALASDEMPDDELTGETYESISARYVESFDGIIYVKVDTDEHPFSITSDIGATNVRLTDGLGNPILSFKGALSVFDSDVNAVMVNEHLIQETAVTDPLRDLAAIDDSILPVTDGTKFNVDDFIILSEGANRETDIIRVISISVNDLTIDKPLEHNYTVAGVVTIVLHDLNVDGTIAAPQIFQRGPPAGEIWHIYRLTISMTHNTVASDDKFGNLSALPNGLVIRQQNGIVKNLSIWKDNGDILEDAGVDLRYSAKSGGGLFGTAARWTFKRAGTVLSLHGDEGDVVKAIVQDSLALRGLEIKLQGHVEGQ